MQTITKTYTAYKFSELSEEAKQLAIDNYRDWNVHDDWYDFVYEQMTTAAECLGISIDNIYFSGFWSQGDGACFTGKYSYNRGWKKALLSEFGGDFAKEVISIGEDLQEIQRKRFYQISTSVVQNHLSNYSHENTVTLGYAELDNGEWLTDDEENALLEAFRDFMRLIYVQLEAEYEYLTSDKAIAESLEANDLDFDEHGEIV